jgi:peptidoglycan/LPS O-acetylase OafA/YrhL
MDKRDKRIEGYDFIRTFAILVVFLSHTLKQSTNKVTLLTITSLSPGLTMSLLGFISAALLSARDYDFGAFLIKRFTRIYISLILCLIVILSAHALLGKKVIAQHTLLHVMGLSAFFELLLVQSKVTIGAGLWFITAIILMYLVLPLLQKLFRHPRGLVHLFFFVALCTALNFLMYGTQSIWNVVISFGVGVYCGVNGHTKRLIDAGTSIVFPLLGCIGLLIVVALSTAYVLPYSIRGFLFAFYPLTFVPFLFAVSQKLPTPIVAASSFFAGLSYEFYILHFYFINEGFKDFFPASTPLYGQIIIAFVVTFALACIISKCASWLRKVVDKYLLASSLLKTPSQRGA